MAATIPLVSVVICTRDRPTQLQAALAAAQRMVTSHPWELIVVDNGSESIGDEICAHADPSRLPSLRVLRRETPGLGGARDVGWRASDGELIAFTDDDCYFSEDFIDQVVEVFAEDQELGAVGGRVVLFDPSDFPITILRSTRRHEYQARSFIPPGAVMGANLVFRREALDAGGGFDHSLGAGTPFPAEDLDAAAAVSWAGYRIAYDPRVVVAHHHGRKTANEAQKLMRTYDAGRGAYFAKYVLRADSRADISESVARIDEAGDRHPASVDEIDARALVRMPLHRRPSAEATRYGDGHDRRIDAATCHHSIRGLACLICRRRGCESRLVFGLTDCRLPIPSSHVVRYRRIVAEA